LVLRWEQRVKEDSMNEDHRRIRREGVWRGLAAFVLVVGTLITVLMGNISRSQAQDVTKTDASIRFVHASPGAPNVDVLIDGQPAAQNLAFGAATDYIAIPSGDHKVQIVPSGQGADAALAETDLSADGGNAYEVVALGRLKDIEAKIFEVNLDALDAVKARVRVIHASPDAGSIDVVVSGGDTWFGGVDFKDATDYKDVDAGTYSLDVKGDNDRVLLTAQGIDVAAGSVYDIVALGQVADTSLTLVPLETSVSEPCAEVLGLKGGVEDACVRVVHAAPGTGPVDVYVNDSPVAQGVTFGTSTNFVVLPSGDGRKVQVTTAGKAPGDGDLLDADIDLDGRGASEVVVTGDPDDLKATTAKLDLSPLPGGQGRLRIIHASTDAESVDIAIADGQKLFEGVDFRDVTDYKTIDAGTYKLQVKKGDTIALTGDATLDAGMVYDTIVVGRTADNTLALLILAAQASVREGGIATPESQGTAAAGTAESTVVETQGAAGTVAVTPTSS
jgi:hypothetical protein